MKVSRQQVAYNRKLILDRASRLFRKKGFDGVGIVDIMKSAGLTHGGFYGHFRSKDQLIAESCADALTKTRENWENEARHHPDDPLGAVVRSYLTAAHRDDPATGCVFAAVGAETARRRTIVRRPFTQEVRTNLAMLERFATESSKIERRKRAIATLAGMVGALILARAVDDESLSNEILSVAADGLDP